MKNLTSKELRELYLRFFRERGHTVIPSASLIPETTPPCSLPRRVCIRLCRT